MSPMIATKNDLPEPVRSEVVGLLNSSLADTTHLAMQAKQAHWNVKGPHFLQLHELFDKLYDEATEWVDLVAERAVQLGGVAEGRLEQVSKRTRLPSYALGAADGHKHLEAILTSLGGFAKSARESIAACDKLGDADTADLFTEISRAADKILWMVEAHL